MRRVLIPILAAAMALLLSAPLALAVPLHQHYLTAPSGTVVPIARGVCDNEIQTALEQLHANVHLGAPTTAFAGNPIGFSAGACP